MKTVACLLVSLGLLATIADVHGAPKKTPKATREVEKPRINPELWDLAKTVQIQSGGRSDCDDSREHCIVHVKVYAPRASKPEIERCAAVVIGDEVWVKQGVRDREYRRRFLTWEIEKADRKDAETYEIVDVDLTFDGRPAYQADGRDFRDGAANGNYQRYSYKIRNSRVRHQVADCEKDVCEIRYAVTVASSKETCDTIDPKISNDGP